MSGVPLQSHHAFLSDFDFFLNTVQVFPPLCRPLSPLPNSLATSVHKDGGSGYSYYYTNDMPLQPFVSKPVSSRFLTF